MEHNKAKLDSSAKDLARLLGDGQKLK